MYLLIGKLLNILENFSFLQYNKRWYLSKSLFLGLNEIMYSISKDNLYQIEKTQKW